MFCMDYYKLNSVTIQDAYPLPRIDELLDALAGSKFFSTLDLLSGTRPRLLRGTGSGSGRCCRSNLRPAGHLPATHRAGPEWFTLEDLAHLSR